MYYLFQDLNISPVNSRYSSLESFDEFEREIVTFATNTKCICLVGDFNSRLACAKDYIDLVDSETMNHHFSKCM